MPLARSQRRLSLIAAALLALAWLVFAGSAAAESRLYWANNGDGTVGTAGRAGTGVNEALFTASPEPYGIAADSSHVYWSDEVTDAIGRAELDGGNVEPSLVSGHADLPEGMAVDAGHIYWANVASDSIGRANLDGSDPEQSFIQLAGESFPEGVAVDGSHIYWAAPGNGGDIGRANLAGGEVDEEFITGLGGAISALAVNSGHIYWTEIEAIGRASIAGGEVEAGFVEGIEEVNGIALDNGHIFWTSFLGDIGRSNIEGGEVEPEFITGAETPDTIAVSRNATTTNTAASTPSVAVGQGVHGTATLGGSEETEGTITFSLFGPGDESCTGAPLQTSTVAATGNGSYQSPPVTPASAGTYHWVSSYSGDTINEASASACAAGAFTVKPAVAAGIEQFTFVHLVRHKHGPLHLVKVTRSRRTGIGRVRFRVPSAGTLTVSGKGVKTVSARATKAGPVVLVLTPRGAYKARLRNRRHAFTWLAVKFEPRSGAAIHFPRRVRLVKR